MRDTSGVWWLIANGYDASVLEKKAPLFKMSFLAELLLIKVALSCREQMECFGELLKKKKE